MDGLYHQPARAILLCQCFAPIGGTGISTSCPSPTTFVLGLGPDLPWADEPSPGNLGLSTCKFLACIALLIPAFSLLRRPALLTVCLQPAYDAPLPLPGIYTAFSRRVLLLDLANPFQPPAPPSASRPTSPFGWDSLDVFASRLPEHTVNTWESEASVACFSPGHLRRTITRPVSYYALFE